MAMAENESAVLVTEVCTISNGIDFGNLLERRTGPTGRQPWRCAQPRAEVGR